MWIEITNLVVPTLNDKMDWIKKMCLWIKEELGEETPLHFSRFSPMYKIKNLPPTPVATLEEVVEWYDKGGHPSKHLSDKIRPLNLTEQDQADLVEFMKACTGPTPTVETSRLPADS